MTKQRTMTEADKAEILRLARQGKSRSAIAKEVGWALTTVARLCRESGVEPAVTLAAPFVKARALSIKERQVAARERKLDLDELYDARVMANLRDGVPWVTRKKTQGGGEEFVEVPFIPGDDYRNATSAAASNASAFRSYAPLETEQATERAKSVLDKLIEANMLPAEVPDE